jgi:hypothetical protein
VDAEQGFVGREWFARTFTGGHCPVHLANVRRRRDEKENSHSRADPKKILRVLRAMSPSPAEINRRNRSDGPGANARRFR